MTTSGAKNPDNWSSSDDALLDELKAAQLLAAPESLGIAGQLGPYQIVRALGRGATSIVLLGYDPRENRFVAIKVLAPDRANEPTPRENFAREAELLRKLQALDHPNLLKLLETQLEGTASYLVTEYVEPGDLSDRLNECGSLDETTAVQVGIQVADALAAVHRNFGVWHRDLKPSNVLLDRNDGVRVADFGLAFDCDDLSAIDSQAPKIVGTVPYIAPEVASGGAGDSRSDIYALGCLLYQSLTGQAPFQGNSASEVLQLVRTGKPPSLSSLRPKLSPELAAVVEKAMAPRLSNRYAEMGEVRDDLLRISRGEPIALVSNSFFAGHPGNQVAIVAVVLLLTALVAIAWRNLPEKQTASNTAIERKSKLPDQPVVESSDQESRTEQAVTQPLDIAFKEARVFAFTRGANRHFGSQGFAGNPIENLEQSVWPARQDRLRIQIQIQPAAAAMALIVEMNGSITRYLASGDSPESLSQYRFPLQHDRDWILDGVGSTWAALILVAPQYELLEALEVPEQLPDWNETKLESAWKWNGIGWSSGTTSRSEGNASAPPNALIELSKLVPDDPNIRWRGVVLPVGDDQTSSVQEK